MTVFFFFVCFVLHTNPKEKGKDDKIFLILLFVGGDPCAETAILTSYHNLDPTLHVYSNMNLSKNAVSAHRGLQ